MFSQRLDADHYATVARAARAGLAERRLSALLTDDPADVAYLTGFFHHPCERPVAVLLDAETTVLLVPELEREHAQAQHAAAELVSYPEYPGQRPPLSYLPCTTRRGRIGLPGSMTLQRRRAAAGVFAAELVESDLVDTLRLRKYPAEVALHAEAARITDLMLTAGRDLITDALAAGTDLPSEAELAAHVSAAGTGRMYAEHTDVVVVGMLAGGLVYAGGNSAYPHGLPSAYRLRPGDTFMLSLGCAVGGRYVEGERTFVLGEPTAEQRRYHDTVRQAQAAGAEAIQSGAVCAEINRACLDVIRHAGLGDYLRHRQGHGIGLGMHEPPWLADGDPTVLRTDMIVSNEPGIYVPGHAGYRISDSMLVTATGARPLTTYPRDLDDLVIAL